MEVVEPVDTMSQVALLILAGLLLALIAWAFWGDRVASFLPSGKRAKATLLLGVATATLVFGTVGWFLQPPPPTSPPTQRELADTSPASKPTTAGEEATPHVGNLTTRLIDAVYLASQHLFLNAPTESQENLWKLASRLCAMATVVLVAFEALTRLFADSIQKALLRRKRGHIVICGLGATGLGLVRHFRGADRLNTSSARRPTVVMIDANPSNEYIERCRELGAVVLHGDATDERLLESVRAERAAQVYFVTGSDEANIEGACDLRRLIDALGPSNVARPQISIHLRRAELALLLEPVAQSASAHGQSLEVQCFNILEQAADDVMAMVFLHLRPRTASQVLHVVIVGMSPVAQRLAVRIAEQAHYENCKRTRMTILVSPNERAAVESFRAQYPRFFPNEIRDAWNPEPAMDDWGFGVRIPKSDHASERAVGVTFAVNGGFAEHSGGLSSPDVRANIVALAKSPGVVPVVLVCGDEDEEICTTAIDLHAELLARCPSTPQSGDLGRPVAVAAYVPSRPSLAELVRQCGVVVFGIPGGTCAFTSLAKSAQRPLAERLAAQYLSRTPTSQTSISTSSDVDSTSQSRPAAPFIALPLWERRSNLAAAGHLSVKLAAVNLRVVDRETDTAVLDGFNLSEDLRSLLAVMEHNRWLADRLISGWQFGERSNEHKRRMAMVDWKHLSQDERVKDYAQVDELFRWLLGSTEFALASAQDTTKSSEEHLRTQSS